MFSRFKSGPAAKISLAVAITLMAAVAAGGCASQYGRQTVKINYYPGCYQPITQLRKDESAKTRNTVLGGIIGGVAGGVIGYQKGGIKGAAIGAAGGALLGAAASYLITNEIQKKSAAERLAAYSEAMNQDLKNLSSAAAAAKKTNDCYEKAYKDLDALYNAGKIDKAEMAARLAEMRDGTNDANAILLAFSEEIAKNQLVYQDIQKREAARPSGGLSQKQRANLGSQEKQLGAANSEARKTAALLKTRADLYAARYKTITSTARGRFPMKTASAAAARL